MHIPIDITLPKIWKGKFSKHEWGYTNFIVGPNGTGKSLLSNELKNKLSTQGFKVRLLSAERLSGLEKESYAYYLNSELSSGLNISNFDQYKEFGDLYGLSSSAFITLKERLDIRIRIEAILSDLFQKTIHLVEDGGYLKPKMQDIYGEKEYELAKEECHGMKEIISLLTFLFDDSYDCLIFDEPELHLHPQFQSFFLNEIRKLEGNPKEEKGKKIFFIITHSPYFLDIRSLSEINHIIVCHYHRIPTFIEKGDLDQEDEYVLTRFISRFNTHHKQFLFSLHPVFVEGYTDQQIISLLLEGVGLNVAASGSSIIDVGGKSELAVFCKLCDLLSIKCSVIADFDALFRGKLRKYLSSKCEIRKEFAKEGYGIDISQKIGELERTLSEIGNELLNCTSDDEIIVNVRKELEKFKGHADLARERDVVLLLLYRAKDSLKRALPAIEMKIEDVLAKYENYIKCLRRYGVYILPDGQLEHFFKSSKIDYLNIANKEKLFYEERELILGIKNQEELKEKYKRLLDLVLPSIPKVSVNMERHLSFAVMDWIQNVQRAVARKEIKDAKTLKTNVRVDYKNYSKILECKDDDFVLKPDGSFECTITIKADIIGKEKNIKFTDRTVAKDVLS